MRRRWHKFKAWRGLHPGRMFNLVALGFVVVAVAGVCASFYFHFQDQSQIRTERAARVSAAQTQQIASRAFVPLICHLVYAYRHLPDPSDNASRITNAWTQIGARIGCPDGTAP